MSLCNDCGAELRFITWCDDGMLIQKCQNNHYDYSYPDNEE